MGARKLYEVTAPYVHTKVAELDYAQTADVLYVAHLDYKPRKLTRYGHSDWRWATITFGPTVATPGGPTLAATTPNMTGYVEKDYTYKITAIKDSAPVQESRASASNMVHNDLDLLGNYNTITVPAPSGDITRHVIYKEQGGGYGYIGSTEGTTFKDQNLQPILSEAPPTGENPFAVINSFPGAVGLHQQRLVFGATRDVINGTWMSRSADLENMDRSRPARADDSLSFAVIAEKVNGITHYVSMPEELLAFTTDSIYAIQGGESHVITPGDINPKRMSGRGARKVKPLLIDTVVFYVPSRGNALRGLGFSFEIEGYKSDNVAIFSPHLFDRFGLTKIVFQEEPFSCIWGLRADGQLLCFTWEAEQQVWGWSRIVTDGTVEEIETIPEGGYDRLYALIRRTINGVEHLFHERLSLPHVDIEDANHLDCSLTQVFDPPIDVIPNLWHLEGAEVSAHFDGYVQHGLVVEDGKITLPSPASVVSVGLRYRGRLETLPAALTAAGGSNHVNTQQITDIIVRCVDTRGIEIGASGAPLEPVEPKDGTAVNELMNVEAIDYSVTPAGDWKATSSIVIEQNEPLPAHIVAIFAGMQGADQ